MSLLGLPLVHQGKVRELYELGDAHYLMVASDRISAFDVVMQEPIPNKGRVLTAMTAFWCSVLGDIAPGSLVSCDPAIIETFVPGFLQARELHGRSMVVAKAEMLPLECIVRGYLAGQAYEEYEVSGTIHSMPVAAGLALAEKLPEVMFTPSTKAEEGHDLNISVDRAAELIGSDRLEEAKNLCLALFQEASRRAREAGLILADTKFELGLVEGNLVLCDEVITPDSSRIWPADQVVVGSPPPAFDKQPFRDWLSSLDWNKQAPPPPVPAAIIAITADRYREAYERVTGLRLEDWYGQES